MGKSPTIRMAEFPAPLLVLISGTLAGIYLYSVDRYSLLYYGDSISHLVAARKLVDWVNPGISQIGTVWLPMQHFLLVPFALNDFLFATGLAGTMLSLPALALASLYIVKIVYRWHASNRLALSAGLVFSSNPSLVYMGIVPMQEPLFLLFAISSVYHIHMWHEQSSKDSFKAWRHLYISVILIVLATLTRYEAWLFPIALTILAARKLILVEDGRKRVFLLLYSLASFGGIASWLLWNAVSFGDPLAFLTTPFYSYLSQATSRPFREFLFLKPLSSLQVLLTAMEVMYGAPLLIISSIGLLSFVARRNMIQRLIFVILLGLPTIATYVSLLLGVGEIFHQGGGIWFNSRFLVLASGIVAFGSISFLKIAKRRALLIALTLVLISSAGYASVRQLGYPSPPMVMKEAYAGFSYRNETFSAIEMAKVLRDNYNGGTILMLTSSGDAHKIMVFSGIHLKNFRDLFAGDPWPIQHGGRSFNEWVMVSKRPSGDALYAVRFLEGRSVLLNEKYEIVKHNDFFVLMKLASP